MKHIFKVFLLLMLVTAKNYGQVSKNKSYQVSIDFKEPTTTNTQIVPNQASANTRIVYYDGLGRPIQQNSLKASGTGKDIISHIEYDLNGNRTKEYLAVPTIQNSGSYISNAKDLTNSFYNIPEYENTLNPYSEKVLEKSPEGKMLAQGFPGNNWNANDADNHAVKFDYKANAAEDAVKKLSVSTTYDDGLKLYTPSIYSNGYYGAGELYKNIVKNENWVSGVNNTTEEFKNKLGQVVLKRAFNNNEAHDTYYAYDLYGNLAYVIPPLANGAVDGQSLTLYCYQYKYDYRNRLVEKKVPQKEWEYIVYDNMDRVVMNGPVPNPFGDGTKGWLFTKYDALGRVVYTGYYASGTFSSAARNTLAQNSFAPESRSVGDNTIDGIWANYTNNSFPTNFTLLQVNYYDSYSFPYAPTSFAAVEGQAVNMAVKGQLTGTRTRNLTNAASKGTNISHQLYDDKYRIISVYTSNHVGGYTQTDNKLSFTGMPIRTVTYQKYNGSAAVLTLADNFTYDGSNRLLTHTQQINSGTVETLVSNVYDELGVLTTKNTGGTSGNLQKVDYTYNIRGWLTDINNAEVDFTDSENDLFQFRLNYNLYAMENKNLFNGNISSVWSRTKIDNVFRGYVYWYDDLNRLTKARNLPYHKTYGPYMSQITDDSYGEALTYDKNGNIATLNRTGQLIGGQPVGIDALSYSYDANQLQNVSDATNHPDGFRDGNTTGTDYVYDSLGNITQDLNKGITAVTYNHLNLPYHVQFANGGSINYTYDALGTRLSKKVQPAGGAATTTDYLNGFEYENGVLQTFPHPEGYVKNTAGTYIYHYIYRDHLGNNRLVYADLNKNGSIQPASEIIEENNYYPFGLKHKGYNELPGNGYKYKYAGKELNSELGLDLYDFGARNYDAALGRWLNMDPLAENSRRWTPYNYAYNNPIVFVDPDGMQSFGVFTELYNTDGKKIGEDVNGNDGNVSIIKDKDKAKEIEKNYKKGGVASQSDVNSGVLTTKTILSKSKTMLEDSKKITNGDELSAVIEPNGKVHDGTAPTRLNDGAEGVSRTELPTVQGNDNVSMHSHDVKIVLNSDGTYRYNDARVPGPDDPGTFTKFKQNVIVGNLGAPNVIMVNGKPQITKPSTGAVIYDRQSKPVLELNAKAINNIIKK